MLNRLHGRYYRKRKLGHFKNGEAILVHEPLIESCDLVFAYQNLVRL